MKTENEPVVDFSKLDEKAQLEFLKAQAAIELRKVEAQASAREASSKFVGRTGIPAILVLVILGVVSSIYLPAGTLTAVIGLISTATMALITMMTNIIGPKEKEPAKKE